MVDIFIVMEPEDILELGGERRPATAGREHRTGRQPMKFLSVWYRCCHTYGRMYKNRQETMYIGRCPRCGARVQALIGPGGTNQRMFEAR